ncbi:unnamed protein product [Tilletia controversa]|nr:unnamed protein product [Tilletia controversa]
MAFSRKLQWRSCRAQRGSGSKVAIFGEMAASKLRVFPWGHPPETKEERRLLVKIDFFVMSFLMLMYWSNYLNRTNLTSAYVSGMREKLNFQGTQFNTVNTVFTVRYICRLIPNNLALQIVPARIWLPSMALIWSGLSMCLAAAKNPGHIMAIRFFQALAEAWLRRSLDLTTFLDYGTRKRSWASGAVSSPARRSSGVSSAECYKEPGNNFAWANDVMRDDDQERAMVLASMNIWSNVVNLWWSIVLYPATDAPRFKKGMIATICVAVVTVIITLATRHLDVRERKRYRNDAVSRPNDNV